MSVAASWRSAADWRAAGLPLTTTNDRACKLFDAALTQFVSWTDDPLFGGLGKTATDCTAEDPTFVMGRVLSVGLQLLGSGNSLKTEIEELEKMTSTQPLSDREKRHVKALKAYSQGFQETACEVWEDILLDHPTDMLALKFAHGSYFFMGQFGLLRDSVASVLPLWKPSTQHYNWLHGMHAFGLEETFLFPQAELAAKKGLEMNPKDAWATHALAHVYEMQGRTEEGIAFMSSTVQNWQGGNHLAKHNYWHWALHHLEQNEPEAALDILKIQLKNGISDRSMLDIADCTSLLWRLKLQGVDVSNMWSQVMDACRSYLDDNLLLFNGFHLLMACLGSGDTMTADSFIQSFEKYLSSDGQGTNWTTCKEIGLQLFTGVQAMSEERYGDAVSALYPIRNEIYKMGGSYAQRDLFNIVLIASAVKSTNPKDQALARKLLMSRKLFKGRCSLAERLNYNYQPYLQA